MNFHFFIRFLIRSGLMKKPLVHHSRFDDLKYDGSTWSGKAFFSKSQNPINIRFGSHYKSGPDPISVEIFNELEKLYPRLWPSILDRIAKQVGDSNFMDKNQIEKFISSMKLAGVEASPDGTHAHEDCDSMIWYHEDHESDPMFSNFGAYIFLKNGDIKYCNIYD